MHVSAVGSGVFALRLSPRSSSRATCPPRDGAGPLRREPLVWVPPLVSHSEKSIAFFFFSVFARPSVNRVTASLSPWLQTKLIREEPPSSLPSSFFTDWPDISGA